jgi:ferredoxin-NADP reductase
LSKSLVVTGIDQESADVLSLTMQSPDGQLLPTAMPGQYVVVRLQRAASGPPLFRSYSLSGPLSSERYRISVKIEPNGAAGTYLREHVRAGDTLDVSSPRGSFILQSGDEPVVLLSAGIGATPLLAMLYALAVARSTWRVSRCTQLAMESIIRSRRSSRPMHALRTAVATLLQQSRPRATRWAWI